MGIERRDATHIDDRAREEIVQMRTMERAVRAIAEGRKVRRLRVLHWIARARDEPLKDVVTLAVQETARRIVAGEIDGSSLQHSPWLKAEVRKQQLRQQRLREEQLRQAQSESHDSTSTRLDS